MSNDRDGVREFDELPTNVMQSELLEALANRTRENGATSPSELRSGTCATATDQTADPGVTEGELPEPEEALKSTDRWFPIAVEAPVASTDPAPGGEKPQRPRWTSPAVRRGGWAGIAVMIVGLSAIAFFHHRSYRPSLAPTSAPVAVESSTASVVTEAPAEIEQRPSAPLPAATTPAQTTGAEAPAVTIGIGKTADAKRPLRGRSKRKKFGQTAE
jgi:hypothetical protein